MKKKIKLSELKVLLKNMYHKCKKCDNSYFNKSIRIISDAEYDALKEKLEKYNKIWLQHKPNSKLGNKIKSYLSKDVGAKVKGGGKVTLYHPLPSLGKIKTDEPKKMARFLTRIRKVAGDNPFTLVISPKLDGSSTEIHYKKGTLYRGYTRGDGVVGRDITTQSNMVADAKVIPRTPKSKRWKALTAKYGELFVRGEFHMKESTFVKKWQKGSGDKKELSESRNAVNGFVNATTNLSSKKNFAKDLTFFAYNIFTKEGKDVASKVEVLSILQECGFTTYLDSGFYHVIKSTKLDSLQAKLDKWLKLLDGEKVFQYKCDGLVVECSEPKIRSKLRRVDARHDDYVVAYKVSTKDLINQEVHITTVKKVEWNPSKSGALVPLVYYDTVKFGNTSNGKANGVNAANILKFGIGKGTKVKVVRGGNVIPQIVDSEKSTRVKHPIPSKCQCGAPAIRLKVKKDKLSPHIYCTKPATCTAQALSVFESQVHHLKVDGLRSKKLEKIYNAGYDSLYALLKANAKQLAAIDGFSEKTTVPTLKMLHDKFKASGLADLAVVSNCFVLPGFSIAQKGMTKIEKVLGKKMLVPTSQEKLISKLKPKVGEVAATCFAKNQKRFIAWHAKFKKFL